MPDGGFDNLIDQPVGRVECGGGGLRYVGDSGAAEAAGAALAQCDYVLTVEDDTAAGDADTTAAITEGGKAYCGFAGA